MNLDPNLDPSTLLEDEGLNTHECPIHGNVPAIQRCHHNMGKGIALIFVQPPTQGCTHIISHKLVAFDIGSMLAREFIPRDPTMPPSLTRTSAHRRMKEWNVCIEALRSGPSHYALEHHCGSLMRVMWQIADNLVKNPHPASPTSSSSLVLDTSGDYLSSERPSW